VAEVGAARAIREDEGAAEAITETALATINPLHPKVPVAVPGTSEHKDRPRPLLMLHQMKCLGEMDLTRAEVRACARISC
jgi:hypothetical protein